MDRTDRDIWYNSDEPARHALSMGRTLWEREGRQRQTLAEDCLALYLGSRRHSMTGQANPLALLDLVSSEASTYNVIQAITDTKIAHTMTNQVRSLFVTEGGDSDLKEKVEQMQEAVDGLKDALGLNEELALWVCTAGYLFECGMIEWSADIANSQILATPVWPWEYAVPRKEARYGRPRQLMGRQVIDRNVLLSFVANEPKRVRDAVENAPPANWEDVRDEAIEPGHLSDQVVIYKWWHLPSGRVDLDDPRAFGRNEDGDKVKANHDGRHVVVIDGLNDAGACLIDTPYPWTKFPISKFQPNYVPGSFWGRGEPEILATQQIELNRWNARVMQILNLHARPLLIAAKSAKIAPAQITNALANILLCEGSPSQALMPLNPSMVPPDLIRRLAEIPALARDQRGMSEMSMTARKPSGINHEPGLAYLADTESVRHTPEFKAWERFHHSCADNIIRCLRILEEESEDGFEAVFESDKELKRVKWGTINVDSDRFRIRSYPTNLLKQSPGQRADQIMDFVDRGIFTPEQALDAIDAPDIKSMIGDRAAMEKNIQRHLAAVVKKYPDEEQMPHPYMDLKLTKKLTIQKINQLQAAGESFDRVQRVIKFAEDVDALLVKMLPPPPPPMPPPGPPGLPPGLPPPPPGAPLPMMNGAPPNA